MAAQANVCTVVRTNTQRSVMRCIHKRPTQRIYGEEKFLFFFNMCVFCVFVRGACWIRKQAPESSLWKKRADPIKLKLRMLPRSRYLLSRERNSKKGRTYTQIRRSPQYDKPDRICAIRFIDITHSIPKTSQDRNQWRKQILLRPPVAFK